MGKVDLETIVRQLESENVSDRVHGIMTLRTIPAHESVPLVKKVLDDEALVVRSLAISTLGMKVTPESCQLLMELLAADQDSGIRANAVVALGHFPAEQVFQPLIRAFYEDTHWLVRFSVAMALGQLKDPRAKQVLIKALQTEDPFLQQGAIAALGEIGEIDVLEVILDFVESDNWLIRRQVAQSLGNLPDPKSTSALQYLAQDCNSQVRQAAEMSLNS